MWPGVHKVHRHPAAVIRHRAWLTAWHSPRPYAGRDTTWTSQSTGMAHSAQTQASRPSWGPVPLDPAIVAVAGKPSPTMDVTSLKQACTLTVASEA